MVKNIILDFIRRIRDDDITAYAAQITYYLLLSMFPFIVFLMAIISHISLVNETDFFELSKIIPSEIYYFIDEIINEINHFRSQTFLSFTVIITIWSASRGVRAIMNGMNKAYKTRETRTLIKKFAISFIYTIALALVIIISMALVVFGNKLTNMLFMYIGIPWLYFKLWTLLRYLIPIAFLMLIFTLIYRTTPNKDLTIKQVYPGAIFATTASIIVSQLFSFYIDNFANFSLLYGSIGSIIILLLWLYIISIIMMLGGEFNASINNYH